MTARHRYLDDLAAALPLPDGVREDVVEELAAHLTDTIADLEAQGRDPVAAQAEALRRLGSPAALGRELARAHRGTDRLLAAAGGGVLGALGAAIPATFFAWIAVVVATIVLTLAVRAVGAWLGLSFQLSTDAGWNTALSAFGLNVGALLAGAAAVRGAARSGWRTADEVRFGVTVLGGVLAALFSLVFVSQAQNWASVVTLVAVPVAFGVGARFDRLRGPALSTVMLGLALGLLPVLGLGVVGSGGGSGSAYSWDDATHGYEAVGPWWQDRSSGQALDFLGMQSESRGTGVDEIRVTAASPAVLAGFRNFRLEAWRAEPPGDSWRLMPGQHAPFATADAVAGESWVSGTIRFDETPGVEWTQIVVTAVGRDGVRYIIAAGGPEPTVFNGNVVSWFAALVR
jgi:hypothetical protein